MLFSDKFIETIQENHITSIIEIIEVINSKAKVSHPMQYTENEHEILFEGFSLILSTIDSFELNISATRPILDGNIRNDCESINAFLQSIYDEFKGKASEIRLEAMTSKFNIALGQSFAYEFSQGDLDRVQVLINELREQINNSSLFEEKHKARLLKRLEKLQAEMHKKMSDVDKFWGLVGDAGIVIGKFGKDSKPFVDRIKEISDIVWRTQSRAEELPSGTPPPLLNNDT